MRLHYTPIPTEIANSYRSGQPDAFSLTPERNAASSGRGTPCRHCLKQVPKGEPYLILAHRPFKTLNPYSETGPIFLCANDCPAAAPDFPAAILTAPHHIVRGYSADERIIYGTGAVVNSFDIPLYAADLFARPDVAFIHIRSASNNCYLCRIDRV
ncbi:DUF1203 domain-containing protein [Paracoccus caeni]|uniref:DUF1203 domain-containing protein n=1 Tax=Paracoccus caeni TaxID=657651 RepID=A0A934SC88_9RHOB|nr:DUF1203 domain-containing protein [Paracoccus caeni]MBK4215063.1 DUF1203 domain-containing protein [Paracoccus caeni]